MTEHIKVEESFVDALVKNAAWDAARVSLVEKKDSGQKKGDKPKGKAEKDDDKPDFTTDAREGDKGKGKDKKDKPDFTTGARAGDEDAAGTGKDYEKKKPGREDCAVEEHVCPLCESILEEDITDEQLAEHIALIEDAMGKLDEEDSVEEDASFQRVMKKVAELKTKSGVDEDDDTDEGGNPLTSLQKQRRGEYAAGKHPKKEKSTTSDEF